MNNFVRGEFHRAAAALPLVRTIMHDLDAIPVEEMQEAAHTRATVACNEGEEEREDEEWEDEEEEEEFTEWGMPRGRSR